MLNRTLGHYRIVEKIGEGGMGVVYKAVDLTLGRHVALKIVHERLTQSEEARARLMREAQIAAALNHPNICTIHEVFEAGPQPGGEGVPPFSGGPVIALELIDGDTLRAALNRVRRFGARDLVDIGVQIADGLAEAHQRRIVHRDLKPQNILLTSSGRVKILDFGLAKAVTETTPTHDATTQMDAITDRWQAGPGVLGTAPYMSPEQAAGKPLDSRSDVFAFGTVLYELAAGQRPFRGDTSVQVVAKILEADPPPLSAERPDLPPEIERIIRRCLQKTPDDRYNDTRDLCADLRTVQDALRLTSGRSGVLTGRTGRLAVATARQMSPLMRWGAIAAAVLILAVGAFWFAQQDRNALPPGAVAHRQLTFTGESSFPAISPDGTFIAYVRGEPWGEVFGTLQPLAPQKVVIQDLAGGGQTLEVAECQPCSGLTWSPDGTSLLVADWRRVRLIPRLGGAVRQLEGAGGAGTWSPDGSEFAFGAAGAKAIHVRNVRTGVARELPLPRAFVWLTSLDWSSSGDQIAVITHETNGGSTAWIVPAGGGPPREVFQDTASLSTIRWSPRADALYYLRRSGDSNELWKTPVSADTGQRLGDPAAVMTGIQVGPNFTIARDGRILYTRELRFSNLWSATLTSPRDTALAAARQLTSGTSQDQFPALSPDGSRVAFVRRAGTASNVFVLALDGGTAQQLTFVTSVTGGPAWSPDGRTLAYCARSQDDLVVWRIDAAGGAPAPFPATRCTTSGSEVPVMWAPRREILYQRTGNRNYHVLDPVTGNERPLFADESTKAGWVFGPRSSPDGARLAVFWNRAVAKERAGTWLLPFAPGAEIGSPTLLQAGMTWPLAWSADGKLLYVYEHSPTTRVLAMSPASAPTVLRDLKGQRIGLVPSISLDGKTIVYSAHAINSDVWLVEHLDPGRPGK